MIQFHKSRIRIISYGKTFSLLNVIYDDKPPLFFFGNSESINLPQNICFLHKHAIPKYI